MTFDEIHAMTLFPDYTRPGQDPGAVRRLCPLPQDRTGGDTGWHSHPGIIFGLVQSGTLTYYHDDGTRSVFPAGTGFVESPGDVHNSVNEGTENLEMAVFFLVPKGRTAADRRARRPSPDTCSSSPALHRPGTGLRHGGDRLPLVRRPYLGRR